LRIIHTFRMLSRPISAGSGPPATKESFQPVRSATTVQDRNHKLCHCLDTAEGETNTKSSLNCTKMILASWSRRPGTASREFDHFRCKFKLDLVFVSPSAVSRQMTKFMIPILDVLLNALAGKLSLVAVDLNLQDMGRLNILRCVLSSISLSVYQVH